MTSEETLTFFLFNRKGMESRRLTSHLSGRVPAGRAIRCNLLLVPCKSVSASIPHAGCSLK
jgi:hypothetical protein